MPASNTEAHLRALFDAPAPVTVGIEEELMLLDAETLELLPRAPEVLARLRDDPRFKRELPRCQLEIATAPHRTVADAAAELAQARSALADAAAGIGVLAGGGAHPFSAPTSELNSGPVYDWARAEYGPIVELQLVFGLHVHVAVRGAERALAVYNALRGHLPEIAALGADAPYYQGRDSGLASIRPKISGLLPRQGVPPTLDSWRRLADDLDWGVRAGVMAGHGQWWWEARLNVVTATLEVRVPDAQMTVADTAAIAAVVQCLCAALAERFDAGEPLPCPPTWRVEQNRWSACRWGVEGTLARLDAGERVGTRERLLELIAELEGNARVLGCSRELHRARELAARNGAMQMRELVADGASLTELVGWMSARVSG